MIFFQVLGILLLLLSCVFVMDILSHSYAKINIFKLIYIIFSGKKAHYLEKYNLVRGDLVIIEYRGKYRKAYIKEISNFDSLRFQLYFDDDKLNCLEFENVWYPIDRVLIPRYFSRAAKILFTEMEKDNGQK